MTTTRARKAPKPRKLPVTPIDEAKLLRDTARVLRKRASAQRAQIEAQAEEARSLSEEVDIYGDAVEKLINERDDLRLQLAAKTEGEAAAIARATELEDENATLRARLAKIDRVTE